MLADENCKAVRDLFDQTRLRARNIGRRARCS